MVKKTLNTVFQFKLKSVASVLAVGVLSSSVFAAPVPVVESRPVDRSAAQVQTSSGTSVAIPDAPSIAASDSSGTAFLLNTIEQLRQEMMELRGQIEEQQFQINRLKQENRDRYLDLDERITRLNAGEPALSQPKAEQTPAAVVPPVTSGDAATDDQQARHKAEEQEYQAAFKLIRERQFDEAKVALRQLLKDYPQGRYADNALYWLGEVQMAQAKYPEAQETFEQVLKQYPQSGKIADASYKLGRLHDLQGDKDKARQVFEAVIKNHPDSAAARLSDTYLRGM